MHGTRFTTSTVFERVELDLVFSTWIDDLIILSSWRLTVKVSPITLMEYQTVIHEADLPSGMRYTCIVEAKWSTVTHPVSASFVSKPLSLHATDKVITSPSWGSAYWIWGREEERTGNVIPKFVVPYHLVSSLSVKFGNKPRLIELLSGTEVTDGSAIRICDVWDDKPLICSLLFYPLAFIATVYHSPISFFLHRFSAFSTSFWSAWILLLRARNFYFGPKFLWKRHDRYSGGELVFFKYFIL